MTLNIQCQNGRFCYVQELKWLNLWINQNGKKLHIREDTKAERYRENQATWAARLWKKMTYVREKNNRRESEDDERSHFLVNGCSSVQSSFSRFCTVKAPASWTETQPTLRVLMTSAVICEDAESLFCVHYFLEQTHEMQHVTKPDLINSQRRCPTLVCYIF